MQINHLFKLFLFSFFLTINQGVYSNNEHPDVFEVEKDSLVGDKLDYTSWKELLSANVDEKGDVNYQGFIANKEKFNTFLELLSSTKITSDWTTNDKIAYWINVYNAFTIKLILDNYPTKSIKDISGPWKQKFIKINGEELSLGEVEHEILRKQFNEPRIHFAINCASASCPPVLNEPYLAGNLNALLEQQTKNFINNQKYNKIASNKIELSKIFDWYRKDFEKNGNNSVVDFINKYSTTKISSKARRSFLPYDWNLNGK